MARRLVGRLLTAPLAVLLGYVGPVAAAAPGAEAEAPAPRSAAVAVALPPVNAAWDYQIGRPYAPPEGVTVVSRDRTASPVSGAYALCYVNAYQTQPGEIRWWKRNHPQLLLTRRDGSHVVDGTWGEVLLDVGSRATRQALARVVGRWIAGCARDGFDAVEPDNLDSWTRSGGLLTRDDAFAFARLIADRAHGKGLAIGQKNAAGHVARGVAAGFDFAVAEECGRYRECGTYAAAYDDRVLVVEYRDTDFDRACARWGDRLSIVRRDRMVTAPGSRSYVFTTC